CSNSVTRSLAVSSVLGTPGAISGPTANTCIYSASTATYSVAAVSGASSYTWTMPSGATIASGQGTNSVSVNFISSFASGTISVTADNACKSSTPRTLMVSG